MDVFEAVQERSSVRAYKDQPVPRDILQKILEAGRLAPSARNTQPWHFIVATDSEKRKILSKGRYAKFLTQSPVVIVACGDKEASADWYAVDVSLAVENMILTAQADGLGTCCVGSFDEKKVHQTVKAPDNFEVPASSRRVPERKARRGKQTPASGTPKKKPIGSHKRRRIRQKVRGTEGGKLNQCLLLFARDQA